jgi:hypothetical protein
MGKAKKPEPTNAEWWRASELGLEPHEILGSLVDQMEKDQDSRYSAYREYARLFGSDPDMFGNDDSYAVMQLETLNQNELANTIETLHAQVFKNRVVPAVAASEADYEEWSRAKAFSRWIEGVFTESEVHYDALPRAGLDMFVYGTGFVKIGHDEDSDGVCSIRFHRVDPRMVLVDRLEARHGRPRSFYEKDFVDKYKLLADYSEDGPGMFGSPADRVQAILDVQSNDDDDMGIGTTIATSMVTVREAWHLPTKKGRKDGRHVIWIKGCTLVDEPFAWDRFPFTVIRYGRRLSGYYGKSAVQVLAPTQRNHDKLNAKIDEAQDIMAVPRIIVGNSMELSVEHIDDVPGGIIRVNGPVANLTEWNATAISPEIYAERAAAPEKMRSLLGVNSFDTQSQLPAQLREVSGPALERILDAGTARHALVHAELQRAVTDLANMAMAYAKDLEDEGKDLTVLSPGSTPSSVEALNFSEVAIDAKRMRFKVMPMAEMPQTFAGKVEHFGKLLEQGVISPRQYSRMLEVPDDNGATDLLGSREEIIMKNLHHMVKNSSYIPPLQYDDLELIVSITTDFINWYRIREGADMEVVGMLGQYIEDAIALKDGLGAPAAAPVMAPPVGPSEMVPPGPTGALAPPVDVGVPVGTDPNILPPPMGPV